MRGKLGKCEHCLVLFGGSKVNEGEFKGPGHPKEPLWQRPEQRFQPFGRIFHEKCGLAAVPLAIALALVVHWFAAKQEPWGETELYTYFLGGLLVVSVTVFTLQLLWRSLRDRTEAVCPLWQLLSCLWGAGSWRPPDSAGFLCPISQVLPLFCEAW